MEDEGEMEFSESELALDSLPFDCIACVCEYLSPEDLCRFGAACKLFYEVSLLTQFWRYHCLSRWAFCDILKTPKGPQRWRRYFLARRRVEASLDRGRPLRDYKVKSLRGHKANIKSVVLIQGGGGDVDWEEMRPPLVVSLSEDKCVKAWNLLEAKPVWSLEGSVVSIASTPGSDELATGGTDGSLTLWDTRTWAEKTRPPLSLSREAVEFVRYGRVKEAKWPDLFLMVLCTRDDDDKELQLWDPESIASPSSPSSTPPPPPPPSPSPMLTLRTSNHQVSCLQLCTVTGLLAISGNMGDIDIWSLSSLPLPSPTPTAPTSPHLTVCTNTFCIPRWVTPGLLATSMPNGGGGGGGIIAPFHIRGRRFWNAESAKIELWDVAGQMKSHDSRTPHDLNKMYHSQRAITCRATPTVLAAANGVMVVGLSDGRVQLYECAVKGEGCLQEFADHKAAITDMYVDRFRVLTCSRDFSIRVYRWVKSSEVASSAGASGASKNWSGMCLESRYTLLGGSVAQKTHDGFEQVLCETSNCIGVAGDLLKFYNFSS